MKTISAALMIALVILSHGCGESDVKTSNSVSTSTSEIKDGDYPGKGKVTKINNELGSVEMDHDDIPGLMPAMRMEFYVADNAMLNGLAVGDSVDFVILYKKGTETITKLTKK